MMRAARFKVDPELLRQVLDMPEGSRIIQASIDARGMVEFVADDPQLPEADRPHDTGPTCRRVEWSWNVNPPNIHPLEEPNL